jgi:hypothetical protein
VTGSRYFTDAFIVFEELDRVFRTWLSKMPLFPTEKFTVIHGQCPKGGADLLAERWVEERKKTYDDLGVVIEQDAHPPDRKNGFPAAYHIRNQEMVQLRPDLCLVFYQAGALNRGTQHTVKLCIGYDVPVRPFWSNMSANRPIVDLELP